MQEKPSSEERILSVISHLSALAFGMGLIIPVAFWSGQREKSKYAAFQSLQAYGYQSLGYTVWLLLYMLVLLLVFIALFLIALFSRDNLARNDMVSTVFAAILIVAFFILLGIYIILPIIAAVMCGLGRDFRYPILGGRLGRYLGYDSSGASLDSASEERWLAAMGHFAVIQPIWGMLGPIFAWIDQGKRSVYLKIQSVQTTIYQAIVNLFALGMAILSVFSLVLVVFLTTRLAQWDGEVSTLAGLMMMVCVFAIALLILPIFHILGQWAGLRVLQGHDFRYPLLGQLVERWVNKEKS